MLASHVPLDFSTTTELVSNHAQEDLSQTEPTVPCVNPNAQLVPMLLVAIPALVDT